MGVLLKSLCSVGCRLRIFQDVSILPIWIIRQRRCFRFSTPTVLISIPKNAHGVFIFSNPSFRMLERYSFEPPVSPWSSSSHRRSAHSRRRPTPSRRPRAGHWRGTAPGRSAAPAIAGRCRPRGPRPAPARACWSHLESPISGCGDLKRCPPELRKE